MNSTLETILSHRSIRKFTQQPIDKPVLDVILQAGVAASSSSLLQVVSIIRVTEQAKRDSLVKLSGNQPYVAQAAEFLVFCIDYQRHTALNANVQTDYTELGLIGAIDAGIMAQNCLVAAESLGLGGVYIGGLRNSAEQVDALLGLPRHCAVLFGMCLGHPDQQPEVKPRLPLDVIIHENEYHQLDRHAVNEYDNVMISYYANRSTNHKAGSWSSQVTQKLEGESRPHMLSYLNSKGLFRR